MDKDAYYFPHFSNARNDRKLRRIKKDFGISGYGVFFMLLEVLREQTDFKYPFCDIDLLADEFCIEEEKLKKIILNYDLFALDDNDYFYSENQIKFLKPYLKMKEQRRLAGLKSAEKRRKKAKSNDRSTTVQRPLNKVKESKVKESKVKESKVKESKVNKPLSDFDKALLDFSDMRKKIKKPLTDRAKELILKKLESMTTDKGEQIKILNQSTMNCWQGVFPLKENKSQTTNKSEKSFGTIYKELQAIDLNAPLSEDKEIQRMSRKILEGLHG